jgi:hypothetical protein
MPPVPQPTPEYAPFDPAAFAADFASALAVPEPVDFSWMGEPAPSDAPEEEELDVESFIREEAPLIADIGAYNIKNPPDFLIEDPVLEAAAELAEQQFQSEAPAPWDNPDLWAQDDDDDGGTENSWTMPDASEAEPPSKGEVAQAVDPALVDLFAEIAKPVSDDELNSLMSQAVESGFSGAPNEGPREEPVEERADGGPNDFGLAEAAALLRVQVAAPGGGIRILAASDVAGLKEVHPEWDVQAAEPGEILRAIRQASLRRDAELCRLALCEAESGPSLPMKIWNWVRS